MADLTPHGKLVGKLSGGGTLSGSISTTVPAIGGSITVPQGVGMLPYDGVTEVIPRADAEVVLPTMRRFVNDDIVVREIPYYEISNEFGTTVNIGG